MKIETYGLEHGGKKHADVLPKIQTRIKRAINAMSERHTQWAKNEEQFLAYLPVKENDSLRKTARTGGTPQFTTLEIPYSYAVLLTAHTYITSVFMSRAPILQISGRHGEAQNAEMAMEALLDYQLNTGGHLVPMYVWTLDSLKYGTGIMGYYWDEESYTVRKSVKQPRKFFGMDIPGTEETVTLEEKVRGYVGTRAYNVRPADFFPDPSFPVSQFQKGEYCGRYIEMAWLDIVDGAARGEYFNVEALKTNRKTNSNMRIPGSTQVVLPNDPNGQQMTTYDDYDTGVVHLHELYVRLIPADWGLGKSTESEKWVFLLAEDTVIISCKPLGYYHNKFPFEVLESEIDGHSLFTRSMLEVMKPLNDTLTWLLNTHFYNVRKTLNDMMVVDPSRVVMKDMTDPNPGRLIRLKPEAYGSDTRMAVTQLQVTDITRSNISDTQLIQDMIQRSTGVNDSLMGMVNSGRKTATEVRSSTTFGINRLKTTTEYMSAMGFSPWTQQLVQVTQQLFGDDRKYKIVGDASIWGEKYMNVTPEQIAGFYDFIPVDGTLPVDRFAQVNLWKTLLEQMQKMPQLLEAYDTTKIFAFVAQLAGLKNIEQFRIQIVPNGQMQQQVQAGNSVPMTPDAVEGAGEPNQLPGMGATL
jgi:hypothetical protein